MSLLELGRFARNEAYILIGHLETEGILAFAFDGNASIADGSAFFIPVRVMVDDDDLAHAREIVTGVPDS
jgi:hypothetical protein